MAMDIRKIQKEVTSVGDTSFAHKTDKQLWLYQKLSDAYLEAKKGQQPEALKKYNSPVNRKCKLTHDQVKEIRERYIPHVYGKKRLAADYGVSTSVILRIIRGESWKIYDDDR
jgi:hypothetical protein